MFSSHIPVNYRYNNISWKPHNSPYQSLRGSRPPKQSRIDAYVRCSYISNFQLNKYILLLHITNALFKITVKHYYCYKHKEFLHKANKLINSLTKLTISPASIKHHLVMDCHRNRPHCFNPNWPKRKGSLLVEGQIVIIQKHVEHKTTQLNSVYNYSQ